MFVPFDTISETSRIWIYQSNRPFSEEELAELNIKLKDFLQEWAAHGANLKASFEIRYNRFIIIALDQSLNAASGCSIDTSVHFIQQLEKEYNVELLDKMNVSFKNGDFIAYKPLSEFRKMARQRAVSPNTIVFNNLLNTKAEYLSDWEVPASDSWHKRFFN